MLGGKLWKNRVGNGGRDRVGEVGVQNERKGCMSAERKGDGERGGYGAGEENITWQSNRLEELHIHCYPTQSLKQSLINRCEL